MTFVEYVQRVRLQRAGRLLLETDDAVGKIAMDVGFGSLSHFTTAFGKYYHTTPQKSERSGSGKNKSISGRKRKKKINIMTANGMPPDGGGKERTMNTMSQEGKALVYRWDGEVLSVMPWGRNSFACVPPCWERWRIRIMPCLPRKRQKDRSRWESMFPASQTGRSRRSLPWIPGAIPAISPSTIRRGSFC